MNILNISQILPIPGIYKTNDFVLILADHILEQNPQDTISFIRPVPYTNNFLRKYFQTSHITLPGDLNEYQYYKHTITIFRFLSAWSRNNLHAVLTLSLYWMNKKRIKHIITKNKIDIVHAQFIFPDGLLALILKRKYHLPYVISTHTELKYFNSFLSNRFAFSILKNASKITPLNHRNLKFFYSQGLNKLEIMPLGIDKSFFINNPPNRGKQEFRIITLGDLIKLKNIDKVLTTLSMLMQHYDIRLTIIGQGPEENSLKKLSENLKIADQVDFCGYIQHDELPQILANHNLFILPSYPETFGRVYFEAMAAGLPVICAVNSGVYGYFPELVDKYAVNPENLHEMAEKIEYFIRNEGEREIIGKKLQSLVYSYSWEKIAMRYREIFLEAIQTA